MTSRPISSLHINNIAKNLFKNPGNLQDGDVVEFIGEQSCGKSSLIQELMITCLLPQSRGGCGCGVVYFDLDCHVDLLQIVSVIEQKTKASEEEIKLWLKNLYLLRCNDMSQVVVTLHSIETLLANSKVPIGMIVIDSISSFYWIDAKNKDNYFKEKSLRKVVDVLRNIKEQHRLCVIASTQCLVQSENSQVSYKSFLCQQWLKFVNHRFLLKLHSHANTHDDVVYAAHSLTSSQPTVNFTINEMGVKFSNSISRKTS